MLFPDVSVKYWPAILVGALCSVTAVTSNVFPSTTSEKVSESVSVCKFSVNPTKYGLLTSGVKVLMPAFSGFGK